MIIYWCTRELLVFRKEGYKLREECSVCTKKVDADSSSSIDWEPLDEKRSYTEFIQLIWRQLCFRYFGKHVTAVELIARILGAALVIFNVEYAIHKNKMEFEAELLSAGQLIPLLIGVFSIVGVILSATLHQMNER